MARFFFILEQKIDSFFAIFIFAVAGREEEKT